MRQCNANANPCRSLRDSRRPGFAGIVAARTATLRRRGRAEGGPGLGSLADQGRQGADQAGDGRAGGGGIGLGAAGEGADHQLGGRVDHGPLVAGEGLDHRSGLVPEGLEATHGGDGRSEVAPLDVGFTLLEQIQHGVHGGSQGGLAGGSGGLLGGFAGGLGRVLGRLAHGLAGLLGSFLGT